MPCKYPKCEEKPTRDGWCGKHWGLFPHKCEKAGCDSTPIYDDEPFCFKHSPDEGSSKKGYSAWGKEQERLYRQAVKDGHPSVGSD